MDIVRLDDAERESFDCGDSDLNEFFKEDSILWAQELISVTYAIRSNGKTIAFYSLSNDSIQTELSPRSAIKRVLSLVPFTKRLRSMPAVKIGRLATSTCTQSKGIGGDILNYIKISLTSKNKTGCRFIVVDAYNNDGVLRFYERNDFKFMTSNDVTSPLCQDSCRL